MFRSYSSADYELIRIDFSSDEKANPGKLVCKVPIPSLVAKPLLAEDFGFKIQFNFNFQASWMQNNVQKDLFFKLQCKTRTTLWAPSVCISCGMRACYPSSMIGGRI